VLHLKKEELLLNKGLNRPEPKKETPATLYITLGIFLSLVSFGTINQFHLINDQFMTPIALVGATLSGLFIIIQRILRS
jgi:hypothetical protein